MRNMTGLLKVESALIFAAATFFYFWSGASLWLFLIFFFAPDLSFAAYLAGPKVGAWMYNAVHSYGMAAAFIVLGLGFGSSLLTNLGLIMIAHIGFDRMLGYGLKHETAFTDTHLGRIGKGAA